MLEERAQKAAEREAAYLEKAQRNLAHLVNINAQKMVLKYEICLRQERLKIIRRYHVPSPRFEC